MPGKNYGQNCTLAFALDILGDRWTLLVIRDLLPGPRRFKTLLENLRGIGPNLLTARLQSLAKQGIIEKVDLGPPHNTKAWQLTPSGRELEPIIVGLAAWGLKHPPEQASGDMYWSPMWNYVACKARFSRSQAGTLEAHGNFRIDGYHYSMGISHGELHFKESLDQEAEFDLSCHGDDLLAMLSGKISLEEFADQYVSGNRHQFIKMTKCFM
jgi:DNA-binding HxlR family transcriptional regulator